MNLETVLWNDHGIGAKPIPMELFPEYFEIEGINCKRASIRDGLPIASKESVGTNLRSKHVLKNEKGF